MKRLTQGGDRGMHAWPEPAEGEGAHLFAARPQFQKLIVMADDDLVSTSRSTHLTKRELVSDLVETRLIALFRYRDDGPPESVEPLADSMPPGWPGGYDGWVVVTYADPENEQWVGTYSPGTNSWSRSSIGGNAVSIAAGDERVAAYANLDPATAADRRYADGLASQVASQALGADIYITDREYLHAVEWDIAKGVAVCSPEEALPLIGLYLRAQGDFRIAANFTVNRGLYFWVGTRELLPASWRWFTACLQNGTGVGDGELGDLGQSVIQRVARALEARDRIHVALSQPQHGDTREEVLAGLDDSLVGLMGAVDATARVAHRVLGFEAHAEYGAGWQKQSWQKRVSKASSALGLVTAPGATGRDTLTILRLLRNSVHGVALQGMGLKESGVREEQSLIGVPSGETEIVEAMDRLGGRAAWGVRELLSGRVHIDAGVFVESLFPRVLGLLDELMAQTPRRTTGRRQAVGRRLPAARSGPPKHRHLG